MKGYKAYKKGLICKDKQYEEGKVYEEDGGQICSAGVMHFCENPLDTLEYYPLVDENGDLSEFTDVEALADVQRNENKCATTKIKIGARLSLSGFIKASIDFIFERTKADGDREKTVSDERCAQLAASGDCAQLAALGDCAQLAASGGCAQLAASGDYAQLAALGDCAQLAASGYYAKLAASGYYAQLAASGDYAQLAASGDCVRLSASGYSAQLAASGGSAKLAALGGSAKLAASGKDSIAAGIGIDNAVKASIGSWIVLAEWKRNEEGRLVPVCVKSVKVDGEIIKADMMYKLKDGEFVELK